MTMFWPSCNCCGCTLLTDGFGDGVNAWAVASGGWSEAAGQLTATEAGAVIAPRERRGDMYFELRFRSSVPTRRCSVIVFGLDGVGLEIRVQFGNKATGTCGSLGLYDRNGDALLDAVALGDWLTDKVYSDGDWVTMTCCVSLTRIVVTVAATYFKNVLSVAADLSADTNGEGSQLLVDVDGADVALDSFVLSKEFAGDEQCEDCDPCTNTTLLRTAWWTPPDPIVERCDETMTVYGSQIRDLRSHRIVLSEFDRNHGYSVFAALQPIPSSVFTPGVMATLQVDGGAHEVRLSYVDGPQFSTGGGGVDHYVSLELWRDTTLLTSATYYVGTTISGAIAMPPWLSMSMIGDVVSAGFELPTSIQATTTATHNGHWSSMTLAAHAGYATITELRARRCAYLPNCTSCDDVAPEFYRNSRYMALTIPAVTVTSPLFGVPPFSTTPGTYVAEWHSDFCRWVHNSDGNYLELLLSNGDRRLHAHVTGGVGSTVTFVPVDDSEPSWDCADLDDVDFAYVGDPSKIATVSTA